MNAADASSVRSPPWALLALMVAFFLTTVEGDILRALGVNTWFGAFPYGWPLLRNALTVAILAASFRLIGGVRFQQQWQAVGLAKPFAAPALFALILFAPAFAIAFGATGLSPDIEGEPLLFGGVVFPVFEELAYRGLAIGVLMLHFRWHFALAALLPSIFFGIGHLYQGDSLEESLTIAALTAFGSFWFGWIYWKWGFNLWPAIWLHVGLNSAWALFALGDTALGGQLGNAIRLAVIAGSVLLTLRAQDWLRRMAGESPGIANAPA